MLEFPAVGSRLDSSSALYAAGTGGYYWSTTQGSNNAYRLYFINSSVNATITSYKATGLSVRCVRQEFTALILIFYAMQQYRSGMIGQILH